MQRVGLKGKISELVSKVVLHLNRFAIVGDIAVSANPNPAALLWAAVRFILLNLTAGDDIRSKIIEAIVEITILEFECSVYQEIHLSHLEPNPHPTQKKLRDAIIEVFARSIRLLGLALQRQRSAMRGVTDAFRIADFDGHVKDLGIAKARLHDAGYLCDMCHNYQSRNQLTSLHDLVKLRVNEETEQRAKMQLKDLLINPKDAFDHIYHPENSFCLEGTRVAVLQDIESWSVDPKSPCICWLPGLAGTGKSTISRTIARDLKGKSLGASFFFKKGAGNRGDARLLFSIIAYQLALNFPPMRQHILRAVEEDPASAMAPMQVQWKRLIVNPLSQLHDHELSKPLVLVIDALDECEEDDRKEVLQLLVTSCPTSLRVFITSRPELDIEGGFAAIRRLHQEIVLHRIDIRTIEKDISAFLKHAIKEYVTGYNQSHPDRDLQIDTDWPGNNRFQLLLQRCIPLFIAAATFIRMVRDRHWGKSPDYKIDIIIQESIAVNSRYEALYRPVLGLVLSGCPAEDRATVMESFIDIIGSFVLLASPLSLRSIANLLNIDAQEAMGQIDLLRSVIDVPSDSGQIKLFHLSFRDYLLSKSAGDLQKASGSQLLRFIVDARYFTGYFYSGIKEAPLQLYYSGVIFSPKASIVPQSLSSRMYPEWVAHPSNVPTDWPQNLQAFRASRKNLCGIDFLSDGRLVSCDRYGPTNVWDPTLGSCLITLPEASSVTTFSDRGASTIGLAHFGSIKIHNLDDGICKQEIFIEDHYVYNVAFSDCGSLICSLSTLRNSTPDSQNSSSYSIPDYGIVHIHDISTRECMQTFRIKNPYDGSPLSSRGQWMVNGDMMLSKWDADRGPSWINLHSDSSGHNHRFSPDGKLLAAMFRSSGVKIKVWCTETRHCLHTLPQEKDLDLYSSLALSMDWIAYKAENDQGVLIRLETGEVLSNIDIRIHDEMAFSGDGKVLAVESSSGVIKTWDIASLSAVQPVDIHPHPVETVAPISNKNTLLSISERDIKIWDIPSGLCKETFHFDRSENWWYHEFASATDAPLFAIFTGDKIEIWNIDPLRRSQVWQVRGHVLFLAISSNGERLAASILNDASQRLKFTICDLKTFNVIEDLEHEYSKSKIALSSCGTRMAYSTFDAIIIRVISGPHLWTVHTSTSWSLDTYPASFSFINEKLLVVFEPMEVKILDMTTGGQLGSYQFDHSIHPYACNDRFINTKSIHSAIQCQDQQSIRDATNPYHMRLGEQWLRRSGKNILWLPPDYAPESMCMVGPTLVPQIYFDLTIL
ncbi:vegetative incompatibility het-e-1 [Fusarium heterosporum]|uniref:Vegetative incompatibility het-e-1 n=1 Tax=Fusarium heterosporum TaxID=42747 RepID=A0A8H5X1T1_FUSHE|nr:vegetative incompatibility het-e-1 [Fusarium heterosporum]